MYGNELMAKIEQSMAEINFSTAGRNELIMHLVDTLLLAHKSFIGYHKDLSIMYHSDDTIKQLIAQYENGRLRTLEYLQMGSYAVVPSRKLLFPIQKEQAPGRIPTDLLFAVSILSRPPLISCPSRSSPAPCPS